MKEYFSFGKDKREKIIRQIEETLKADGGVVFAYIFGSFLNAPSFRDVDVGVFLKDIGEEDIFNYELKLSEKIGKKCNLPFDIIDVKILNKAPFYFLGNIFARGRLLFSRNDKMLTDMFENVSLDMIANEHIAKQSLRELVPE